MKLNVMTIAATVVLLGSILSWTSDDASKSTAGQAQPKNSKGTTIRELREALRSDTNKVLGLDQGGGSGTASSPLVYVPASYGECKTNACYPNGCALCQTLEVFIPVGATIGTQRCYTTAAYPNDGPLRQVNCTTDNAWSIFDSPTAENRTGITVVRTIYHNRSHNRIRAIRMEVDYKK
jgi:hypothetical protein